MIRCLTLEICLESRCKRSKKYIEQKFEGEKVLYDFSKIYFYLNPADENAASPYKSPRKCQSPPKSPMKSPLVDVSNIPMNTPPQGVVKRKILLEEMTKSKGILQLQ